MIEVDALDIFCKETYITILENFGDWVEISQSVHQLLSHSSEKIKENDGRGLKSQTEEGLEANNKIVRNMREFGARKTSLKANLTDVYHHCWLRSDPDLCSRKRQVYCKNCKETDHTIRSCPLLKEVKEDVDDILVKSFFITKDD